MLRKLFFFIVCVSLVSFPVIAQEKGNQEKDETQEMLKTWWNKSSLKYLSDVDPWLLHADITFDYSHMTGNLFGKTYSGLFLTAVRKNRATWYVFSELSKEDYTLFEQMEVLQENSMFDNVIRIDVLKHLYVDAAYKWERDTERLMLNRNILYGGIGTYAEKLPIFNTSLFAGLGKIDEEYWRDSPPGGLAIPETMEDRDFYAGFLIQNGWMYLCPNPLVRIQDRLIIRVPLDDMEDYQIILKATLSVDLTKFVALSYQYELDYFNKAFSFMNKADHKHSYGLTFKFDWNSAK